MRKKLEKKNLVRWRRTKRVRKKLNGSASCPRLCVIKTNKHLFAQVIDDQSGKTLFAVSTLAKKFRKTEYNKKNKKSAELLGMSIAKTAKENNVEKVIFDRGRFKYHGILMELANAARKEGLQF